MFSTSVWNEIQITNRHTSESRPQLIFNVTKWCDAIGDPTCHPETSEHGSPVPASDVRSPAAAPHAADSCPAAAPARPPSAECGHHTTGQMVYVLWVISSWATGCVTTLHIHCRLQSVRDSHPHHPAAVWFISLLVFPKTQWVSVSRSSTWPALGTKSNLRTFLLFSCFLIIMLCWMQITLPASPVTAQLIGRTQNSSSTGAVTTISQQAMLLGNRPANCNQAQMYLRTQMVQTPLNIPRWNSMTPLPSFYFCWMPFLASSDNILTVFFICNQLATCLFLLFALVLLAYSNPCGNGGRSSVRPPSSHLLFTYLLSGTKLE